MDGRGRSGLLRAKPAIVPQTGPMIRVCPQIGGEAATSVIAFSPERTAPSSVAG